MSDHRTVLFKTNHNIDIFFSATSKKMKKKRCVVWPVSSGVPDNSPASWTWKGRRLGQAAGWLLSTDKSCLAQPAIPCKMRTWSDPEQAPALQRWSAGAAGAGVLMPSQGTRWEPSTQMSVNWKSAGKHTVHRWEKVCCDWVVTEDRPRQTPPWYRDPAGVFHPPQDQGCNQVLEKNQPDSALTPQGIRHPCR